MHSNHHNYCRAELDFWPWIVRFQFKNIMEMSQYNDLFFNEKVKCLYEWFVWSFVFWLLSKLFSVWRTSHEGQMISKSWRISDCCKVICITVLLQETCYLNTSNCEQFALLDDICTFHPHEWIAISCGCLHTNRAVLFVLPIC